MREKILQLAAFQELDLAAQEEAEPQARFTALVLRQSRFVFRIAYAVLRNPQDAEDVVQDTFLKLYRSGAWKSMANEKAFLARAAWRIAVDKLGKAPGGQAAEPVAGGANPEAAAVSADWNSAVHRLVDTLPETLRQPLALSTMEELSSSEIGALLGIAEGTVRTRIQRARRILKEKLAGLMESRHEK